MNKIAVIGANEPSLRFYQQAKALGYYIIGIAWENGAVCKQYCNKFYPVSFTEKDEVLRICKEEKVDGITSFSLESALPTVVYVAQHLGLVSNTEECVNLTMTKYSQRVSFEKCGIPVPRYYVLHRESDIKNASISFPVIVKPLDSGGSRGIVKVDSADELKDAFHLAISYSRSNSAIMEEYIDGREFSVETLSHEGRHYVLQITDKITSGPPRFVEIEHHQPANISKELETRIKNLVLSGLTALKIENSPSHTEIKLGSNGELYIIEIGARMGGDFITSDLVRLSTGYDMVKGAIELAIGKFTEPQFTMTKYSGVFFYNKVTQGIRNVIKHHAEYPEIVDWELKDGPLPEVNSNADRMGYFIYQSNNGILKL